jgi:hypothetical protein
MADRASVDRGVPVIPPLSLISDTAKLIARSCCSANHATLPVRAYPRAEQDLGLQGQRAEPDG